MNKIEKVTVFTTLLLTVGVLLMKTPLAPESISEEVANKAISYAFIAWTLAFILVVL